MQRPPPCFAGRVLPFASVIPASSAFPRAPARHPDGSLLATAADRFALRATSSAEQRNARSLRRAPQQPQLPSDQRRAGQDLVPVIQIPRNSSLPLPSSQIPPLLSTGARSPGRISQQLQLRKQ